MNFYFRILSFYLIMMTLIHNFEFYNVLSQNYDSHWLFYFYSKLIFSLIFFPFSGRNWLSIKRWGNSRLLKDKLKSFWSVIWMYIWGTSVTPTYLVPKQTPSIYCSTANWKWQKSRRYHGYLNCTQIEFRSQPRPGREKKTYSALWGQLAKLWLTS